MNKRIPEPEDIALTSSEFLERLRGEYKREVRREHNKVVFYKEPQKYRKMGLNEYLEKDKESQEEMVIPRMNEGELEMLAREANVSISMDKFNRDPGIMILLVRGTTTGIESFREKMEYIHNKLSGSIQTDKEVKVLDVPPEAEDLVIGRNGTNIYRLQKDFKIIIRVIDGSRGGSKALAISGGDKDQVQKACSHITDIIYRGIN
ncbi:hypothetical protein EHEL_040120 [Encephalitozoon hellem ATCC 50504]|uniref:Insulin-like growth factor 2 mRNA-binding protein 1 n=1 Tax=Encephalitozoon hellem TaxID=27973 RepID=A0A9Q9F944_ENCHE|nr:uncharacterized protein EHEL_040120 [Encephalitozoon hellem ATCC 50504]AFM98065.1 hypothetical protein EHEL_040120 [Encephalitozoon hellem ATCC 50504]UTX42906.1 insulin-like growth factor 2 mRNA-binding protein 1 [Encephalitozoon hellem]|eukprot:XP_003887046.1 hypothetical protein EHEL_040120 [Encephalitozoon hellem ATCC 50504]